MATVKIGDNLKESYAARLAACTPGMVFQDSHISQKKHFKIQYLLLKVCSKMEQFYENFSLVLLSIVRSIWSPKTQHLKL